jgi:hypothetical protein
VNKPVSRFAICIGQTNMNMSKPDMHISIVDIDYFHNSLHQYKIRGFSRKPNRVLFGAPY